MKKNGEKLRDEIYMIAVANGCSPFWYDGMLGPTWHCGCEDNTHACDQQCSAITLGSARKHRKEVLNRSPQNGE